MIAPRFFSAASVLCIVACGGATTAPTSTAHTETQATAAATTTATTDSPKPTTKIGLTEDKLHAAKSLSEAFPEADAVIKEIGAPTAQGKGARREWYFDKKGTGKGLHCETVDVIKTPQGKATFDSSVYTGPECAKITATSQQLLALLNALGGDDMKQLDNAVFEAVAKKNKSFDEIAAAFEKKLGKAQLDGEPAFNAWKYTNGDGECRTLLLTAHLGSQAPQALWDVGCD